MNDSMIELSETFQAWLQQEEQMESSTPLRDIIISELPPCITITPVLSTEEPKDSLIMGDEHLDTISEKESDDFIKSSVENLVPNPSESEDEFFGELAHTDLIPPGINETDCDPKEDIHLVKRLLYDNSSPRPLEEFYSKNSNAIIESFSPSPIPVNDSDSLMKEIYLFLTLDDSMSPGIKNDDYDSEGDIIFLK
nr:hypothetical protein [Tanacetum cinerariifolium]